MPKSSKHQNCQGETASSFPGPTTGPAALNGRKSLDNLGPTFPALQTPSPDTWEYPAAQSMRASLRRKASFQLRALHGDHSPAVCRCGMGGDPKLPVGITLNGSGRPNFSNILHCKSPWICPVCAPARAAIRWNKLTQVVDAADASAFATLSISHTRGNSLETLLELLTTASRRARAGSQWSKLKNTGSIIGVIQYIEIHHNIRTGWHPHLHLVIVGKGPNSGNILPAADLLVAHFVNAVQSAGGRASIRGQHTKLIDDMRMAEYAAKGSCGWIVSDNIDRARQKLTRTPWDLLNLAHAGDRHAKYLLHEYYTVTKGRVSGKISSQLAASLDIRLMQPAIPSGPPPIQVTAINLPVRVWNQLHSRGLTVVIMQAIEAKADSATLGAIINGALDTINLDHLKFVRPVKSD